MRSYDRACWTVNRIQRTSVTICNVDTMRTSIDYSVQISFVQHEDLHTYRVSMRKYPITESGSRLELVCTDCHLISLPSSPYQEEGKRRRADGRTSPGAHGPGKVAKGGCTDRRLTVSETKWFPINHGVTFSAINKGHSEQRLRRAAKRAPGKAPWELV